MGKARCHSCEKEFDETEEPLEEELETSPVQTSPVVREADSSIPVVVKTFSLYLKCTIQNGVSQGLHR